MDPQASEGGMIARHRKIEVSTGGNGDIVDVTDRIQAAVAATGIRTGQAAVLVQGSTAAVTTLEFEPGLVHHDMEAAFERIAPRGASYQHEATWNDDNGHSHVRAAVTGPSLALPIVNGRVPLGRWQQVVLMDFDTRSRDRTIHMSLVGI